METHTATKLPVGRIKAFLKQLQQLAWLELFEKWFGFGVKLLWITLFIAFAIYLRKEYKKDIYQTLMTSHHSQQKGLKLSISTLVVALEPHLSFQNNSSGLRIEYAQKYVKTPNLHPLRHACRGKRSHFGQHRHRTLEQRISQRATAALAQAHG